jgi:FMN-dependent NADH-azoreductase
MNILYVDASLYEDSRTKGLAEYMLSKLGNEHNVKKIKLTEENIPPLDIETLIRRTNLADEMNFDDPVFYYAKDYTNADMILIAAPFWDLSFPAVLKLYIEAINIPNLVFKYDEEGNAIGLCQADRIVYITTAGGKIDNEYGYEYIKTLAKKYHGIKHCDKIQAENLDIINAKVEEELAKARKKIDNLVENIKKNI